MIWTDRETLRGVSSGTPASELVRANWLFAGGVLVKVE
jgi:hypothetical protein